LEFSARVQLVLFFLKAGIRNLQSLKLVHANSGSDLRKLSSLRILDIKEDRHLESFDGAPKLLELSEELTLYECEVLVDVSALKHSKW